MKVGDRVVCIYDDWECRGSKLPHPIKGEIYKIDGFLVEGALLLYYLEGFVWIGSEGGRVRWWSHRFRPVLSIGEEVESWCQETLWKQVEVEEVEKHFS